MSKLKFMTKFAAGHQLVSLLLLLLAFSIERTGDCINLEKHDKLNKEDLIKLDREVSQYYYDSYEKLDDRKVSYNEQLFRSIRAIRHTSVLNQFDFIYTDEKTMRQSTGKQVNLEKCLHQLEILNEFAQQAADSSYRKSGDETLLPLSAIDMLEASARPESGVLNGNFYWLGSYSSCEHARIATKHIDSYSWSYHRRTSSYSNYSANSETNADHDNHDIVGRYCVAHLRAKSWPKDDPYFGNRISLRTGLCLPDSCHTSVYIDSKEIRDQIESLTRSFMRAPFDGDQYEVSYLYCTPDEDSPHRQWNLGAKLFVIFVLVWCLLLLYSNLKYQRRLSAMKKLRESIDIRMFVERNLPIATGSTIRVHGELANINNHKESNNKEPMQNLMLPSGGGGGGDGLSSNDATPVPSDVEEDPDGEFRAVKPILVGKPTEKDQRKKKRFDGNRNPETLGPFDFIKAFAVKANVDFLFKRGDYSGISHLTTISQISNQQQQQQEQDQLSSASPTTRRLSASNTALIKNLQKEQQQQNDRIKRNGRHSKHHHHQSDSSSSSPPYYGSKSSSPTRDSHHHQELNISKTSDQSNSTNKVKRVNIDVLDGVKAFATGYIVYAHTLMFFFSVMTDIRFGHERMLDFTMIATINGLQVVGLFYIITGVLLSYLAFSRQKVKQLLQPTFWIIVIVGRYLRLMPAYFLIFWFAKHVAPLTASGAFSLEYRTDDQHPRAFCSNESWLTMLTMSAADVKIPYDCIPQTWYLSNDFRTLLIIPFYIIILALNMTAGYAAILSTIIFSTFKMTRILREADIDFKILLCWQPHVYNILTDRMHDVYTNLSIRLSTYLLGVIVGHILFLYETGRIRRMPQWFKRFGLKLGLIIGSMSFMGAPILAHPLINQYLPSPENLDSDTVLMLMPLLKTIMEISMCITLLSLTTGGGFKWLTELLSSQPARVLSNISYGVFLLHIEVIYKTPVGKYESDYFYLFLYSSFYIVSSNLLAFLVHILYEMPINNVIRFIFKKMFSTVIS